MRGSHTGRFFAACRTPARFLSTPAHLPFHDEQSPRRYRRHRSRCSLACRHQRRPRQDRRHQRRVDHPANGDPSASLRRRRSGLQPSLRGSGCEGDRGRGPDAQRHRPDRDRVADPGSRDALGLGAGPDQARLRERWSLRRPRRLHRLPHGPPHRGGLRARGPREERARDRRRDALALPRHVRSNVLHPLRRRGWCSGGPAARGLRRTG